MRFAEIFKNRKNVTIGIVSKLKSFQPSKSCYSSWMDFKGSYLSWFSLKESIGCLMSVTSSYFNNRNPTSATPISLHGLFQKLDRNYEQNRWVWSYIS
jgi:hypothetical protein